MMKNISSIMLVVFLLTMPFYALAESTAPEMDPAMTESAEDSADADWLYEDDDDTDEDELGAFADIDGSDSVDDFFDSDEDDLMGSMEVYSWFAMEPLDVDESLPDSSGKMHRVLDERFNTKEAMMNLLHFYFSDEIVNELWNSKTNPYTEIDGFLYTAGEGRSIDERIGETEFAVVSKTDNKIEIDVLVHYIEPDDGKTEDTFHYVRELINGEWKYTQFPFFW